MTDALREHVVSQRWFGSKSREVAHLDVLETVPLRGSPPCLDLALVEVRFHPGTHELYQLPLGRRPVSEGWDEGVIEQRDGWTAYDAMADAELVRQLVDCIARGADVEREQGTCEFHPVGDGLAGGFADVRPMGAEQSNSSVVLDERVVLKVYRRLGAGINPELELLRFLTERQFPHIAALEGWYSFAGKLIDATLGIAQRFVPASTDGWDLALRDLRDDPDAFHPRARRLGEVTGAMHATLGSDAGDPSFAPEDTSAEALGLLTATIDEEIERIFLDLPAGDETLEPILGRGQEVREQLSMLTHVGSAGRVIRHHGDYHLGQVLLSGEDDWIVLDFEGEPARTLVERRRKRSPLRDVAGMLRSFAYAATASELLHGVDAPEGWEERTRTEFLEGYLEAADPSLLPPGRSATERLLSVFELEKAVYELRYELDNRPEWVRIPVRGIARLLEMQAAS
jgi:trehalose synthase-fused probable maltokinase